MIISNYLNSKQIIEIILILLPIALLFSNIVAEFFIIGLIIFYFLNLNSKVFFKNLKEPIFLLILFFWLYLILNFFINFEKNPSLERTIFFIRFPLLILSISFFINNLNINLKKIFGFWGIIILIICLDLIFQFFTQVNLFGYKAILQGAIYRLGGFMGDELKISNLVFHFGAITFGYFFTNNFLSKNKFNFFNLLTLILLILCIFITGERANFLTISFYTLLLVMFICFKDIKYFLIFSSVLIAVYGAMYFSNSKISERMMENLVTKKISLLKINSGKNFLNKNSHHFAHYSTAYQIFEDHKLFGVGMKNFRNFCDNKKFNEKIHEKWREKKCALHPHNFYFEILSELGITGFIILLSFFTFSIFKFLKSKNNFIIISTFILIAYFIPFLPRGGFFTNWNAIIFWTIFALIYSNYVGLKKIL